MTKRKTDWDRLDIGVQHSGKAITLPGEPENMPLEKAIEALQRKARDENQTFRVMEQFDYHPHDAAVAFVKAMNNLHGWASPQTRETFFGDEPPTMLSVKVGPEPNEIVQVPIGEFTIPGTDREIRTLIHDNMGFIAMGQVKKKDRHIILALASETRRILREESIYRGKAIALEVNDKGFLMDEKPPTFMDVGGITEDSVLFDEEIKSQISVNLLVPLKCTQQCRGFGIPLKRGILLEGPYGTGKSLTARLTAKIAQDNGWTFILLDKVQGLKEALVFARKYSPAVVFAEDIDRILTERTDGANDLINTIDGVVSKTDEIMVVLTTNSLEKIHKVIMRPGRIDAVISLRPPNAKTAELLIRYYAKDALPSSVDLTNAGLELAGQITAAIRECVERAKLGMIGRGASKLSEGDLIISAQGMKGHLKLLTSEAPTPTVGDRLYTALRETVAANGAGAEHH